MSVTSTGRIIVLSLLLVAVCGAALAFGIAQLRRPQLLDATAAPATLATLPPASGGSESGAKAESAKAENAKADSAKAESAKGESAKSESAKGDSAKSESTAALAPLQAEANAVATELAASPLSPINNHSLPAFDVARIEQSGDAVIAGTAAAGAVVELLRNGERHDQAVADQSGHFVMVPRQLPPGDYELTLRSRLPDGTMGVSKQSVTVALHEAPSSPGPLQSRAEVSANGPGTAAAKRVRQDVAVAQPEATAAIPAPARGSSPAGAEPKTATTVVSRGDSLWRISRLTYGDGARYALVWRANRDRIRDPDRIYPGQTFVLPAR
jgi:nucleoid-associated protein YgaU